jgi:FkbH-like protein
MKSNYLARLDDQEKIILQNIKSNNIDRLINFVKYYDLGDKQKNKIFESLLNISKKKNSNFLSIKILVISNLSFQIYKKTFLRKLLINKLHAEIFFIDFNELISNKNVDKKFDCIIFYPDVSDLGEISNFTNGLKYTSKNLFEIKKFYEMLFRKINNYSDSKIFISNFSQFHTSEFGNFTSLITKNKFELVEKLNKFFDKKIQEFNFYCFNNYFHTLKFGLDNFKDLGKYFLARLPFSQDYSEIFFENLSNLIAISFGKVKKILILDLDNTLWGGILGDDGLDKIKIDNYSPLGQAYLNFQKTILNLKNRGVLLAISSKNNYKNVENAFKKNKNLLLKLDDFVSIKANWKDKASNIIDISKELNLGLDSFVFIDDSPVERELVRSYLPSVTVPEIPSDPSIYPNIILDTFFFDLINYSKEDLTRSKTYVYNKKRDNLRKQFTNIDDYMKSLNTSVQLSTFKKNNYDRIIQLFQRSNQFNFTTIRYSLNDIKKLQKDKSKITMQLSLKDKFSDYGIISLLVGKVNYSQLEISSWVMSCRVLNRTLEEFILNQLVNICKKKNIKSILGIYKPTKKNILVKDLYKKLGFKFKFKDSKKIIFTYNIKDHSLKKTFIKLI